jgi:hypothetical protein
MKLRGGTSIRRDIPREVAEVAGEGTDERTIHPRCRIEILVPPLEHSTTPTIPGGRAIEDGVAQTKF